MTYTPFSPMRKAILRLLPFLFLLLWGAAGVQAQTLLNDYVPSGGVTTSVPGFLDPDTAWNVDASSHVICSKPSDFRTNPLARPLTEGRVATEVCVKYTYTGSGSTPGVVMHYHAGGSTYYEQLRGDGSNNLFWNLAYGGGDTGSGSFTSLGTANTAGTNYWIVGKSSASGGTTSFTASIYIGTDSGLASGATPTTAALTTITGSDATAAAQGAGSSGIQATVTSPTVLEIKSYDLTPTPGFTVSPASVNVSTTGNALTLTGNGATAWLAGTTFAATAGTITAQSVNAATQVATLTYTAPASAATVTLSDSLDAATATLSVSAAPAALSSAVLAQTSATNSSATITVTPVGGAGPFTYTFYLGNQSDLTGNATFVHGAAAQTGSANSLVVTGLTPGMAKYVICTVVDTAAGGATFDAVYEKAQGAVALPAALKIGLYGDSQTAGINATDAGAVVASTLQSFSGITTATVTVQGFSGSKTADLLPPGSNYTTALAAFQSAGVQWVYFMEQANDANAGVSPATHKANILTIANAFSAQGIRVIVGDAPYSTLYDPTGIYGYHAAEDAAVDGVSILRGSRSPFSYFATHRDALGDGVHPTVAGYGVLEKLIGAGIYKAITESAILSAITTTIKRRIQ